MGIGANIIARKIGETIEKFVQLISEARKDDNRNIYLYNSAGDDSVPLDNERLILVKIDGNGRYIATGVLIPSQGANPGEKIFFSRDWKKLEDAKIVAKIKMLNDGSITVDNDTETTDEATGEYNRTIKGETTIIERKDRYYTNEMNVANLIKEDKEETVEGNVTNTIGGDEKRIITGSRVTRIDGNEELKVEGDLLFNVTGSIRINGKRIDLN